MKFNDHVSRSLVKPLQAAFWSLLVSANAFAGSDIFSHQQTIAKLDLDVATGTLQLEGANGTWMSKCNTAVVTTEMEGYREAFSILLASKMSRKNVTFKGHCDEKRGNFVVTGILLE